MQQKSLTVRRLINHLKRFANANPVVGQKKHQHLSVPTPHYFSCFFKVI